MYLNEQEYFVILAEEKNYTRAAERACISQPALSKAIKKLEQDYGCTLILREGRNLSLTAAGQLYLDSAQRMLKLRNNAYERIHAMSRSASPRLRIGINRQYSQRQFAQALQRNHRDYPGELPDVYEIDSRQALTMLRNGLLDMAVALQEEDKLPSDLIHYPLSQEFLAAFVPDTLEFYPVIRDYPAGTEVPVRVFHGKTTLHTGLGTNYDAIIQAFFRAQEVQPNYVCSISDVPTAIEAVKNGMGMVYNYLSRASGFRCPYYYHIIPDLPLRHYIFLRPDTPVTPQIDFLIRLLRKDHLSEDSQKS